MVLKSLPGMACFWIKFEHILACKILHVWGIMDLDERRAFLRWNP
jgi:hypothetical protein